MTFTKTRSQFGRVFYFNLKSQGKTNAKSKTAFYDHRVPGCDLASGGERKRLQLRPRRYLSKVRSAGLATANPYKIQAEDWYVGAAATAYLGVGYYDFFQTMRVLQNCATCRETSPVFAGYFNGRPERSKAALFHFAVNGAFVGGLILTQKITNKIEQKHGLTGWKKHAGDLIITGFLTWATWDRYKTAIDNKRIADKYEK